MNTTCYLIATIAKRTGRVVRLQMASEYPTEQITLAEYQALLAQTEGADYGQAEAAMGERLQQDPHLAWVTQGGFEDGEHDAPPAAPLLSRVLRRAAALVEVARAIDWPPPRKLLGWALDRRALRHPLLTAQALRLTWQALERQAPGYDAVYGPVYPILAAVLEDVKHSPEARPLSALGDWPTDDELRRLAALFEEKRGPMLQRLGLA